MAPEISQEILSSKSRLRIADLLSTRPRTLGELADKTGVSVQAVLKHLEKLDRLGILEKRKVSGKGISIRKLYSLKGFRVGDFSAEGLTVVNIARVGPVPYEGKDPVGDLERIAEDVLVQRRRVRDQARRLGRSIEELTAHEERLGGLIGGLGLGDDERLVIQTAFTEETLEEAEKELKRVHRIDDPRRSIATALAKARRSVKK
ncbi:MAG TPA: winged helix-turn-helix domain-containing protein [Nitrososphaerales archaeon]|nr:winged helix-turn-helix domain-containing protein [Nitrososphaerales archaeon]